MTSPPLRGWLQLFSAVLVALALALATASPAAARNVPGSVSMVQPEIDNAVASSVLDSLLSAARDAQTCRYYLIQTEGEEQKQSCDWGLAFGGGVRTIQGAPEGYEFDFTAAYATMVLARQLSDNLSVFGGLIVEGGAGELYFNEGDLENYGVGLAGGLSADLGNNVNFSLIGSAEYLSYSTSRSGGLFTGDYDAVRYMADARLAGIVDGDGFIVEYGGDLRFVHQNTSGYREYSGGMVFANVDATAFTTLTGIGNLKLSIPAGDLVPYVEATAYLNLYSESDGSTVAFDDGAKARLGVGVDAKALSGVVSLSTGAYFGADGYEGMDGSFNFSSSF